MPTPMEKPLDGAGLAIVNQIFNERLSQIESTTGPQGQAAGFGTPAATVDANVGTPSVTVTASGPNTAKIFSFAFRNLKGAAGAAGKTAYQYAVEGGYTGTEAEFKALLGLTGTIAANLDEINGEVV